MNLFNFIKYKNIEGRPVGYYEDQIYRLAEKRNGSFVLANRQGNAVTPEFPFISTNLNNCRIARDNYGSIYMLVRKALKNAGIYKIPYISENTKEKDLQDLPAYAILKADGTSEIHFTTNKNNPKSIVFLSQNNDLSGTYFKISEKNKNGYRLAKCGMDTVILDDFGNYKQTYHGNISEPDDNGVILIKNNSRQEVYFLPANFNDSPQTFSNVQSFGNDYLATKLNGKKIIIDKFGRNIGKGQYTNIEEENMLGEVVASTRKKGNNVILNHDGKKYHKFKGDFNVLESSPIGVKALIYKNENNKNIVAGFNPTKENIEINPDVNRILIALLNSKKPSARFMNHLKEQDKINELISGKDSYLLILDRIKDNKPELADQIEKLEFKLVHELTKMLNRKSAAHKRFEMEETNKIGKRNQENIESKVKIEASKETKQKIDDIIEQLAQR